MQGVHVLLQKKITEDNTTITLRFKRQPSIFKSSEHDGRSLQSLTWPMTRLPLHGEGKCTSTAII